MSTDFSTDSSIDVREYFAVLRRRLWIVAAVAVLGLVAAGSYSYRQRPLSYRATSKVLVRSVGAGEGRAARSDRAVDLNTARELILSRPVADLVKDKLKYTGPAEDLLAKAKAELLPDTQVIQIGFTESNPEIAKAGANAFADSYVEFNKQQTQGVTAQAVASTQASIAALETQLRENNAKLAASPVNSAERANAEAFAAVLSRQIADLRGSLDQLSLAQADPGQVIARADSTERTGTANHVRDLLAGLFAGLALGVALAFVRDRLDERVRSREEVEEHAGARVLAVIPRLKSRYRRRDDLVTLSEPNALASDAYRRLRSNVSFLAGERGLRTLLVTSALPGDGKTTTVANLAVVLARSGKRVVIVSADLRRPTVHRYFHLNGYSGLADVLSGHEPLANVVQRFPESRLSLVASGNGSGSSSDLLSSEAMRTVLARLSESADIVLIDSPPALVVADALAVAPLVDGVLIVAGEQRTSRRDLAQLHSELDQAGARVVGAVVNFAKPGRVNKYYSPSRKAEVSPSVVLALGAPEVGLEEPVLEKADATTQMNAFAGDGATRAAAAPRRRVRPPREGRPIRVRPATEGPGRAM